MIHATSGSLTSFNVWWQTPGVSEFVSAIVGAVIGSLSAGVISWLLQRASFKKDRIKRAEEKRDADRAQLLQAFYACVQAVSDLHKFNEEAETAKHRAVGMGFPKVHGLSNSWSALNPLATLPRPIAVNPEAITVFIDHNAADLAMEVLDVVAIHRSTIDLWESFKESRRRFGEKVSVKIDGLVTYTPLSNEEIERLYPHLKELTDMADGILAMTGEHHAFVKSAALHVQEFLAHEMGTKLGLKFPDGPAGQPGAP